MKIRNYLMLGAVAAMVFTACQETEENPVTTSEDRGDNPAQETNVLTESGSDHLYPVEQAPDIAKKGWQAYAAVQSNPYGLAVSVNSPYAGKAETTSSWCPPGHGIYWYGDWSSDLWMDNGDSYPSYTYSCGNDIYLKADAIQWPGGQRPQSIKARYVSYGYACASANYNDGGMTQKWEIIGTYNGTDYALGWVLYAHLTTYQAYSINTTVSLDNGPVKIGTIFNNPSGTSSCWGSCHIHVEMDNYNYKSCYEINPPLTGLDRIGIVGGLSSTTGNCPTISSKTNWAQSAINCGRSSAYNSSYDCNKAYDGISSGASKWVSNGASATSWMTLDLGATRHIDEFVVKMAGSVGEPTISNLKYYQIQTAPSFSGPWTTVVNVNNSSQQSITTHPVNLNSRYVAILVTNPGVDNYTRLVEFEANEY